MAMIQPLGDRILVLPAEQADFYDEAKLLAKTDTAKERPQEGTVLAVGPNVKDKTIQPGTSVLYGKFSGSEIRQDEIELVMLLEDDVLGKVDPQLTLAGQIVLAGREIPKAKPHPLAGPSRILTTD